MGRKKLSGNRRRKKKRRLMKHKDNTKDTGEVRLGYLNINKHID